MKLSDDDIRVWTWRILVAWFILVFMMLGWATVEAIRFLH